MKLYIPIALIIENTMFRRRRSFWDVLCAYRHHDAELIKNRMYPCTKAPMFSAINSAPSTPHANPIRDSNVFMRIFYYTKTRM